MSRMAFFYFAMNVDPQKLLALLASPLSHLFLLPLVFSAITVLLRVVTRMKDLPNQILNVLQIGIPLCMANLAAYTAALLHALSPADASGRSAEQARVLLLALVAWQLPALFCAIVQGVLFPKHRFAETAFSFVFGFLVFGFGTAYLALILGGQHAP